MIREGAIISERYKIINRIGTGGMADVYKAVDGKLNRYVAIKVLKREFREDETFVRKFRTEAQSAAGLLQPNIVNIYDVGEDRGLYYIVMEYVDGITLKEYIAKKGKLTPKEVISIAVQVCAAMEVAHERGIIHRDIKPQNIMISKEGKVKVTDFGIAKSTSSNTISTNMMGSVHYTSPEQARGGFSDTKSDIYSLGISMYEMITGELPFDGDSTVTIALQHLQEDMKMPSEIVPDIPYSLERIILKCTQKSPDRRYANVTQLARDLRKSLADPDGDFVVIAPLSNMTDTRKITEDELRRIQLAEDREDEDDDYEERRERRRKAAGKDVDPKMDKVMRILTIVASVIFLSVVIGVIVISAQSCSNTGGQETQVDRAVPKLVGMTEDDARRACEEVGLRMEISEEVYSKTYEKGYIDSQKTQEGVELPEGAIVLVNISKGKLYELPDLSGSEFVDARDQLIDLGIPRDKIKLEEEPSKEVPEDQVIRTNPEAGEWVNGDTEITIYVSTGVEMVQVPNLVGRKEAEAKNLLEGMGLKSKITKEYSSTVPKGQVISQEEYEGQELEAGSTVHYVVSKGPEQVTIPTDLTGRPFSEAKAILQNLGLVVKMISEPNDEYADGYVIAVPLSGTKVDLGSTVEVYVSTGPTVS